MPSRDTAPLFFTPERKPAHELPARRLPSTLVFRFSQPHSHHCSPLPPQAAHQLGLGGADESQIGRRGAILAQAAGERRQWPPGAEKGAKGVEDVVGGGPAGDFDVQEERTLLRQLGSKVQGLIRDNGRLKQAVHSEQLGQLLQDDNAIKSLLKGTIRTPIQTQQVRPPIGQNPYYKDHLQQSTRRPFEPSFPRSPSPVPRSHSLQLQPLIPPPPQPQQASGPLFNSELLTLQKLNGMKRYFTLYINTAIETNDDKFAAEKRYVESLEKRVRHLEGLEKQFEHFKFEKHVKLQESGKKRKNFSIAGPNVRGDPLEAPDEEEQDPEPQHPHASCPPGYFLGKDRFRIIEDEQLLSEVSQLRDENANLQQLYQIVKYNYEREIEEHLRDNQQSQQLASRVRQLQNENHDLRAQRCRAPPK